MRCVAIVLVDISGYLLLDFPHVYHANTSSFCSFPDKNFATDPKIEQINTKSMVVATLSQKCYQKTRTKNIGKRKHRNVVLLTKSSQNTGFSCCLPKNLPNINDTPRAVADARATFLLLLLLSLLLLLLQNKCSTGPDKRSLSHQNKCSPGQDKCSLSHQKDFQCSLCHPQPHKELLLGDGPLIYIYIHTHTHFLYFYIQTHRQTDRSTYIHT